MSHALLPGSKPEEWVAKDNHIHQITPSALCKISLFNTQGLIKRAFNFLITAPLKIARDP